MTRSQEDFKEKDELGSAETAQSSVLQAQEPPDGGYGWVIVGCIFMSSAATWGVNSTFGVFLSFYTKNNCRYYFAIHNSM